MIDSNLFYTEIYNYSGKETETICFSYERYHNIIAASYLLEEISNVDELKSSLTNGRIRECIDKYRYGIVEELFIQVPRKYQVELLEMILDEDVLFLEENTIGLMHILNMKNLYKRKMDQKILFQLV